jgi:hypothetical protein
MHSHSSRKQWTFNFKFHQKQVLWTIYSKLKKACWKGEMCFDFSLRKTTKYGISTKSKNIHRKSLENMETYCYTVPKIGQLIIILERRLWHGIYLAVYCAYVECSCMLLGTSYILYGWKKWVRNTLRVSKKWCWEDEVTVGWRHCMMIIFMIFTLYQTLLGWLNQRY